MCGILAYFNRNGISQEQIQFALHSLKKIKHRGPDGEGLVLINSSTGNFRVIQTNETPVSCRIDSISIQEAGNFKADLLLGHRRLSIIDLSDNGHQPKVDKNGNWIVFNGEIYNYIELRNELKQLKYSFKTETDTEVILKAYEAWGTKCISKLNGMFSIVLFDKVKQELLVINDRFGVKPLYYFRNNNELLFCSELRQIKAFRYPLTYNESSFETFLNHAYLDHGSSTFYNEISRFPCAHYASIALRTNFKLTPEIYYQLESKVIPHQNCIEQFRELLNDSVRLRLRSDVPIGFASSGGLDSSSILYSGYHLLHASGIKPDISTFSAVFPGMDGDESEFIKIIENDLKLKSNYTIPLGQFNIDDFETLIDHQEFPVQSTSYYAEWCVFHLVNHFQVKVLLVGQGGDEILAGYHHHFYRYCRQLILEGKILTYLSQIKKFAEIKGVQLNTLHRKIIDEVKLSVKFKTGLKEIGNSLNAKWNKADKLTELLKMDLQEFTLPTYLRSGDRSSMAFSLEVRHPFLDYRLVDFCFSLSDEYKIHNGWQKWILREAMTEMPKSISFRKDKKGFTTPQKEWMEKYRSNFTEYLNYIPEPYKNMKGEEFFKYSLGAWLKLNNQY